MITSVNQSARPPVFVKGSDQSVTSSTALVNDNDLAVPIGPNETWVVEYALRATYNTSGQLQVAVTVPSGATLLVTASESPEQSAGALVSAAGSTTVSGTGINLVCTSATAGEVYVTATVINGATAGNVTLQFAQQTSNGSATALKAGSFCVAFKK